MKKHLNTKRNIKIIVTVVSAFVILVVAALTTTLIAKYIEEKKELAQAVSTSFHISSDYLEKKPAVDSVSKQYGVTDWGYSDDYEIKFKLYNYEKENVALITEENIKYKINVGNEWTVTVKDKNGTEIPLTDGFYTLSSDGVEKNEHTVFLKRNNGTVNTATVVVSTLEPFATSLYAVFHLVGEHEYDVNFEDHTNYVKVIIDTNNYNGNLKLLWTNDFSPDNTNPIMNSWIDTTYGTITVVEQTTYELIFFKNSVGVDPESNIIINTEE